MCCLRVVWCARPTLRGLLSVLGGDCAPEVDVVALDQLAVLPGEHVGGDFLHVVLVGVLAEGGGDNGGDVVSGGGVGGHFGVPFGLVFFPLQELFNHTLQNMSTPHYIICCDQRKWP